MYFTLILIRKLLFCGKSTIEYEIVLKSFPLIMSGQIKWGKMPKTSLFKYFIVDRTAVFEEGKFEFFWNYIEIFSWLRSVSEQITFRLCPPAILNVTRLEGEALTWVMTTLISTTVHHWVRILVKTYQVILNTLK